MFVLSVILMVNLIGLTRCNVILSCQAGNSAGCGLIEGAW